MIAPRKSRRWFFVTGAVLLLAVALGFAIPSWQRHGLVGRAIPERPDLSRLPAALADRVAAAEAQARSFRRDADGLGALARLYHANGFLEEAVRCYRVLGAVQPREPRWPHLQATIVASFGQLHEALALEQRTLALDPDNAAARLLSADAWLKTNQLAAAVTAYREILVREPDHAYALLGLGQCLMRQGDWAGSRDAVSQAVARHPNFGAGWKFLVTVHEHFHDEPAAREAARRGSTAGRFGVAPDPVLEALADDCYDAYRLSVLAAMSGDPARAQRLLERAIVLAPSAGSYHQALAELFFAAKEFARARAEVEKAVQLAPKTWDAWALLIDTSLQLGDPAAAERAVLAGVEQCPDSGYLRYANGSRLRNQGRLNDALAELALAKRLEPGDHRPYLETALIHFSRRESEAAQTDLRAALQRDPGNPLAQQWLVHPPSP